MMAFQRKLLLLGTLTIWAIKWLVRPMWHGPDGLVYLLGIAPNLIGSFLLPFAATCLCAAINKYLPASGDGTQANWVDFLQARLRFHNSLNLLNFCFWCWILLVVNEYLQLIHFFGRTFDYHDMLASFIGLTASFIYYRIRFFLPLQVQHG